MAPGLLPPPYRPDGLAVKQGTAWAEMVDMQKGFMSRLAPRLELDPVPVPCGERASMGLVTLGLGLGRPLEPGEPVGRAPAALGEMSVISYKNMSLYGIG